MPAANGVRVKLDTFLVAFLLAGLVSFVGTPLVRALARRLGAEDDPAADGRRMHAVPVPRLGGLAIAAGFAVPLCGLFFYRNVISDLFFANETKVLGLLFGGIAILALGVADDLRGTTAPVKFLVQGAVAVAMFLCGFRFDVLSNPFGGPLELGPLALPFTVLWLVGVMNAVNLIDGLDGLAGGLTLISVSTIFLVSLSNQKMLMCLLLASLGGAILGFLYHNFHPATIFMGDAGSLFIGFVLGVVSIDGSKTSTAAALFIPLLALGLPVFDTLLALLRRTIRGRNPFRADRGHVHHRLLALGLSHRQAVMTMYGIGLIFALMGIAMETQTRVLSGVVLALAGVFCALLLRGLRYHQGLLPPLRGRSRAPLAVSPGLVAGEAVSVGGDHAPSGAASGRGRLG